MPRAPLPGSLPRIKRVPIGPGSWRRKSVGKMIRDIKINPQIQELLEQPTWSVASLMPPMRRAPDSILDPHTKQALGETNGKEEITAEKLHHLLKLSALPLPKDLAEEEDMLSTLRSQIHFVKEIQKVDTTGVEPLVSIRDETHEAIWEATVTEDKMQQYFALEDEVGGNGTIRRRRDVSMVIQNDPGMSLFMHEEKDTLDEPFLLGKDDPEAGRRMGNYFYVKRAKKEKTKSEEKKNNNNNNQGARPV